MKNALFKSGDVLGELTIVRLSNEYRKNALYYECKCSCGKVRYVRVDRSNLYRDCGDPVHKQEQRKRDAVDSLELDKNLSVLDIISSDNSFTKMTLCFTLKCITCDLVFKISYKSRWNKYGTCCPRCRAKPIRDNGTLSRVVKELGYNLIEVFYKDVSQERKMKILKVECENGHIRECTLAYLKCRPECSSCNPPRNAKLTEEKIKKVCSDKKLQFLDFYREGKNNYVKVLCEKGHIWSPLFTNLLKRDRSCPKCKHDEEPHIIFLYLQELTTKKGEKYLKYGLTKNEPQYRLKRQKKGSQMDHEMEVICALRPEMAVRLESWLKKNLPREDLGYKFDGYTEIVSFKYKQFLMFYVSHGFIAKTGKIDDYVKYVEELCENFSDRY